MSTATATKKTLPHRQVLHVTYDLGRSTTMSRDGKGWQIIQRLFTKVALVISDARENTSSTRNGAKVDKWFQLEVTDDGRFSGVNQALRDLGTQGNMEMRVRVVLTLGSLEPAKALVLLTDQRRTRIELAPETSAILLEEWRISLDKCVSESGGDDPYPGVYKQAIALMRSLYALLRHLPAWQLRRGLSAASSIRVELFVSLVGSADDVEHEEILGLDHKLVPDEPAPSAFAFPAIATPLGPITLKVLYRPNVRVRLDPLESLWSSAFANTTSQGSTSPASPPPVKVDLDAHAFTPTLLANRQRASLSGSNTPLRTGTSPGTQPPTPIRPRTTSQLSAGGDLSRSPPSELAGPSGLARTRRESLLTRGVTGSVTGAPPSPRRTPTAINAFKSGTLASSPRLGGLAGNSPRTTPGLGLGTPPRGAAGTSPLSVAAGSSPRSDGRRSIEGDGTGAQPQPIKRYSSSFGHRREGSLGARVAGTPEAGSTGSGGGSERHRLSTIGSQSYATEKDDHDLSLFIKDIDTYRAHGLGGSPLGLTEQFPLDSPEPPERRESFPSTKQEQFPSLSPVGERFPPSSLPTRFPTFSPLGRGYSPQTESRRYSPQTESPRPLPLPLESVPPSPAESAYVRDRTSRPASRERFRSGERRLSIDNRYGVRGPSESRERRPMEVLAPLPERHLDERGLNLADRIGLEERTRTMSLGPSRQPLFPEYERSRTTSLTPSHERERTTSFARSRALLTNRGDVEAALQLMNADFEASYTPARTGQTSSSPRGLHTSSSPGDQPGPRRIGSQEVVGRLELSGSGLGLGTRGSVRPGRDTDGWSEGGEWDQRRSGWR